MPKVAFVHSISDFLTWDNITAVMTMFAKQLGPYYVENSKLRNETLSRLETKHWWHQMAALVPHYRHGYYQASEIITK